MVAEGRSKTVQTLPPDGLVLEEVISDMRTERGLPATPQEFRLVIRGPGQDSEAPRTDPADPQEVPAEPQVPEKPGPPPSADQVETAPRRRGRRRRR
ncbi:MAG: hypothetical protein ACRDI1_06800 [Actinomycetota bacterium]